MRSISREDLYRLVWSRSLRQVASEIGVSDVALAKACRRLEVPTPARGYWAKLEAGQRVKPEPLPARGLGKPDRISIGEEPYRAYGAADPEYPIDQPPPSPPTFDEPFEVVRARASDLARGTRVRRDFTNASRSIAKLLADEDARRQRYESSKYPSIYDKPKYATPQEQRRLRLINSLFLALDQLGYTTDLDDRRDRYGSTPERAASVRSGQNSVLFTVEPASDGKQKTATGVPREALILEIHEKESSWTFERRWTDRPDQKLEKALPEILASILIALEDSFRRSALWRHQWRVERREERIVELERKRLEEEARRKQEAEARRRAAQRHLLQAASHRERAETIRTLVHAVLTSRAQTEELTTWAKWAEGIANEIDPLSNVPSFIEGCLYGYRQP